MNPLFMSCVVAMPMKRHVVRLSGSVNLMATRPFASVVRAG